MSGTTHQTTHSYANLIEEFTGNLGFESSLVDSIRTRADAILANPDLTDLEKNAQLMPLLRSAHSIDRTTSVLGPFLAHEILEPSPESISTAMESLQTMASVMALVNPSDPAPPLGLAGTAFLQALQSDFATLHEDMSSGNHSPHGTSQ